MSGTDWIQTYTGKKFFPFAPEPAEICIEDIAHSLAMQCRFGGHSKQFYSVAQHSVLMANFWFEEKKLKRYALLHDASEAYLCDIPRPLKYRVDFYSYRIAEKVLSEMIYCKFGLNPVEPIEIKQADYEVLCEEAMSEFIMSPLHPDWQAKGTKLMSLHPQPPEKAEKMFLDKFRELFTEDF